MTDRGLSEETIKSFGLGFATKYSNDLYNYLKRKGYSEELIRQAGLINIDEKMEFMISFGIVIMFPIMDANSRVIGFGGRVMGDAKPKYLNSPETAVLIKAEICMG